MLTADFFHLEQLDGIRVMRLQSDDGTSRLTRACVLALTEGFRDLARKPEPLIITGNRLPRLVGKAKVLEMFVAAEKVHTKDAMRPGLVDAVAEDPVAEAARRVNSSPQRHRVTEQTLSTGT